MRNSTRKVHWHGVHGMHTVPINHLSPFPFLPFSVVHCSRTTLWWCCLTWLAYAHGADHSSTASPSSFFLQIKIICSGGKERGSGTEKGEGLGKFPPFPSSTAACVSLPLLHRLRLLLHAPGTCTRSQSILSFFLIFTATFF